MKEVVKKLKEKVTPENIVCLIIILCPIFDIMSFLFRNYWNTKISISTFVRPVIPICFLIYIFFKSNKKEKLMWISLTLIYILYGICHLCVTKKMLTGASYGTIENEMQYIFNFTFIIIYLVIFTWTFLKNNNEADTIKINKSITIMAFIYIVSIIFAIIIGKSSYTYIETQTGYKGFIESGNSLSAILILSLFVMLPQINDKNISKKFRIFNIVTFLLVAMYLITTIGTRTGFFGTFLAIGLYIFFEIIFSKNKKIIFSGIVIMIIGVLLISIKGSDTIKRRKQMKESQSTIIDEKTGEVGNMTGDMLRIKNKILDGTLENEYMSQPQKDATIELYNYAVKHKIAGNDTRRQQLIYNIYLVKNQKSILGILFGNGYKANFREMVMENELASMLLNFGFLGFILYVGPIIAILIYSIICGLKYKIRKTSYVMNQLALLLALCLSWLSGYVLFATSSMTTIVAICTLILKEDKKFMH